eukprot:GHVP01027876.1.p1 GENE.GHVP01027876.1~~GHVP01027876.1.p1  ORF type:complete len:142 (+),score=21.19 GHVP01027876.1:1185-1610(+)
MPQKRSMLQATESEAPPLKKVKDEPTTSQNESTTTETDSKKKPRYLQLVFSELGAEDLKDLRKKLSDCYVGRTEDDQFEYSGYNTYAEFVADVEAITIFRMCDKFALVKFKTSKVPQPFFINMERKGLFSPVLFYFVGTQH